MICKKKRYEKFMVNFLKGWVCKDKECNTHKDLFTALKILKLYNKLTILDKNYIFGK